MTQTKHELREGARSWRAQLSRRDVLHASRLISDKLEDLDWSHVKILHCYLPIRRLHEIDTIAFLQWLHVEHPHITVYTPVWSSTQTQLKHRVYSPHSKVVQDAHGIPVVQDAPVSADAMQFDRILVPTLMADRNNNRLGYGRGIYDRFLRTQQHAESIGLCYAAQRVDQLPVEPHDIQLDAVLTG